MVVGELVDQFLPTKGARGELTWETSRTDTTLDSIMLEDVFAAANFECLGKHGPGLGLCCGAPRWSDADLATGINEALDSHINPSCQLQYGVSWLAAIGDSGIVLQAHRFVYSAEPEKRMSTYNARKRSIMEASSESSS